jgi:transposase IS166 family protein
LIGGCRNRRGVHRQLVNCDIVNQRAIATYTRATSCVSVVGMNTDDSLPNDIELLKRLVRTRDMELAQARAEASSAEALIAHLRLTIEKLKRDLFGPRNERKARLLDQMELQLEELEAAASEDEVAVEKAAAATMQVRAFTRRKPARQPFPAHLPRERIIVPGPTACACCGSRRLASLRRGFAFTTLSESAETRLPQHPLLLSHKGRAP